jgi:uncharacterized membrane protein HdeD (DUF308 family)
LAAIALGIVAFALPETSWRALVLVFGAFLFVDGIFTLAMAAQRGRAGMRWGWWLFEGGVSIATGVLTFLWPAITGAVVILVIAFWAIAAGILQIAAAIELRRQISGEWRLALAGVLSAVFGVLLLIYPRTGERAVMWLIGAFAMVFGALLIALGVRLNRWRSGKERPVPAGGVPTAA